MYISWFLVFHDVIKVWSKFEKHDLTMPLKQQTAFRGCVSRDGITITFSMNAEVSLEAFRKSVVQQAYIDGSILMDGRLLLP